LKPSQTAFDYCISIQQLAVISVKTGLLINYNKPQRCWGFLIWKKENF